MFEFLGTLVYSIFYGIFFSISTVVNIIVNIVVTVIDSVLNLLWNITCITLTKLSTVVGVFLTSLLNFLLTLLLYVLIILIISGILLLVVTLMNNKPDKDSFYDYFKTFLTKLTEQHPEDKPIETKTFWEKLLQWLWGATTGLQATVILHMVDYEVYNIGIGYLAVVKPKEDETEKKTKNDDQYMIFLGVMNKWISPLDVDKFMHRK